MMRRWLLSIVYMVVLALAACGRTDGVEALPTQELTDGQVEELAEVFSDPGDENRTEEREQMVRSQIEGRGVSDPALLEAMQKVPRHAFVPQEFQSRAYGDHPLPIGYGQTISQPFVVALMTESLGLEPEMRVLEIGTGSGYQAAILAELVEEVYTIEIVEPLAEQASLRFDELHYDNLHIMHADGYDGWQEHAPYDAIMVTAAPDHVPQPLILQMADDSRMVIPIGPVGAYQELWVFSKVDGELQPTVSLGGVRFVPLTREVR